MRKLLLVVITHRHCYLPNFHIYILLTQSLFHCYIWRASYCIQYSNIRPLCFLPWMIHQIFGLVSNSLHGIREYNVVCDLNKFNVETTILEYFNDRPQFAIN